MKKGLFFCFILNLIFQKGCLVLCKTVYVGDFCLACCVYVLCMLLVCLDLQFILNVIFGASEIDLWYLFGVTFSTYNFLYGCLGQSKSVLKVA